MGGEPAHDVEDALARPGVDAIARHDGDLSIAEASLDRACGRRPLQHVLEIAEELPRHSTARVRDAATLRALATLAPEPGKKGQRGNVPSNVYQGKKVRIVVVKAEHRTFLLGSDGRVEDVFLNAVGAPGSPTSAPRMKQIDAKLGQAEARATGQRLWNSPGAFGARIIGLNGGGQELHGTNAPGQLGLDLPLGGALAVGDDRHQEAGGQDQRQRHAGHDTIEKRL